MIQKQALDGELLKMKGLVSNKFKFKIKSCFGVKMFAKEDDSFALQD